MGPYAPAAARFALTTLDAQRPAAMLWAPVMLALGIALYFALPVEPTQPVRHGLLVLGVLALLIALWHRRTLLVLLLMVPLGVALSAERTAQVAAPILDLRYYGPILGQVVHLDRSSSNALRVTLQPVYLPGVESPPRRVRVSLHGGETAARPGDWVAATGHLSAPGPPVEPGGFDFRRHAWFQGLGAVGYTRLPVLRAAPVEGVAPAPAHLARLRLGIADWIRRQMPAKSGGFAAAILVGDRSTLDPTDLEALRATNLAHLLAISGLHMGLITGCVFFAVRRGLLLVPGLATRFPIKKWAAGAAMAAAVVYLGLSGASIATQRAFIMAMVILGAVWADRPAFTLRAVAFAALIVLILRPESLLSPGFQMSFAATTALVWTFASLRQTALWSALQRGRLRWVRPVAVLMISSSVAGAATAPFGAFHFNQVSQYGLIANLAAVPIMGLLVMPSALVALVLAPLGLAWCGFWAMDLGIRAILGIAALVAGWPQALWRVPAGPDLALGLISLGLIIALLWVGRGRWAGLVVAVLAAGLWGASPRPDVLVSADGRLVGVETDEGRALSRARGAGFVAARWLENDGDASAQDSAALRSGMEDKLSALGIQMSLDAKGAFLSATLRGCAPQPCRILKDDLEDKGALAIWVRSGGVILRSSLAKDAGRPWGQGPSHASR